LRFSPARLNWEFGVGLFITYHFMTYKEKLRDPRWQKKRLEIFQRDDWACCTCHRKDSTLQVHHLIYARREPWEYPDQVYQTLCETCHAERQEITDKIVDAMRLSLRNIPTKRLEVVAKRIFVCALEEMP
jgi:5-methylcytosine-specific restriction endonuclease McrA